MKVVDNKNISEIYQLSLINEACKKALILEFGPGLSWAASGGKVGAPEAIETTKAVGDTVETVGDTVKETKKYLLDNPIANISKLGKYLGIAGLTAVGVNIISYILSWVGKKMNTMSEKDLQIVYKIAPPEIKKHVEELNSIREADPQAYAQGVELLKNTALQDMKQKLAEKGVDVEKSTLGAILTKLGGFGKSFFGSLVLTCIIFFILNLLGIYTYPKFENSVLPGPL